jgi:CubicO group peptidase (beta-lactamase class C family)
VGTRFGPHTNAHTGVHISARELARLGYLMLRRGSWNGRQIVPEAWIEKATRPSQALNQSYGYTWWVGAGRADGYGARGLHANVLVVVPALDLVVVRLGNGPIAWSEADVIGKVVGAVVDA